MRNLAELKINEGGRPVTRPSPTPAVIRELEVRLGVALPESYVGLLRHANGGHPEVDSFVVRVEGRQERWSVNRFYHLTEEKQSVGTVWRALEDWACVLGNRALPFANDGGGNQIFMSFDGDTPSVKLCVHDENFKILKVANSFDAFIDMLEKDPELI